MPDTLVYAEALTERETEVLLAMAEGLSNQEISNTLFIALATVKWYNSQIYSKLGVSNRQDALKQARVLGLLDRDKQSLSDVPHNLFQPTTPFIGRYQELGELDTLLNNPEIRLVTVLAPGGMGKTRLILHVAHQQLANFSDGVFFVELAPIAKHDAIVPHLIDILQLEGYDNSVTPKQVILNYLSNRRVLLVMDNFEHLLEGASLINDILQAAPQVKILTSSRERLNLQGESTFVLNGMSVPAINNENLMEYDALHLFVNGAKRIRSDYQLKETDLQPILDICELVEGMPLGIELAAGWLDTLSPEKIAQELRHSIDILETDMRDIPERHRSMRATFDQSWQRLTASEQNLMMRLAVFRGSFSRDAAAYVAQVNLLTLRRLVNKSLLTIDATGRYHIHELLRQYCEEQLITVGKYDETLNLHAAYYTDYLEKTKSKYDDYDPITHKEIHIELDNLIMAWERIVKNKDFDLLRKCIPLIRYLSRFHRNPFAIKLLQNAIHVLQPQLENQPNLKLLHAYLAIELNDLQSYMLGDRDHTIKKQLQAIIDELKPLGYTEELVLACCRIANPLIWDQKYYPQIQENLTKALNLPEIQNDKQWQIVLLTFITSNEYRAGKKDKAMQYLQQIELLEQSYQLNMAANLWSQLILIDIYIEAEKYQEANVLLDNCLIALERTEDIFGISMTRNYKTRIAWKHDDIQEAKIQIAAIIHWHQVIARDWQMLGTLWWNYAVWFLMKTGEDERAVEVLSMIIQHPDATQFYRDEAEETLETLYARMDSDIFKAAFERGKHLQLKQIVADAMTRLTSPEV